MKKIYVLDDNNQLQEIDAGATKYEELEGLPFYTTYNGVKLVGSSVTTGDVGLTIIQDESHSWTEEEVLMFCEGAESGRYDIRTAAQGYEILLIDLTNEELGRRYRRINVDYDTVWDRETSQWIAISDTSAKQLIYKFLNEDEIPSSVVVGDPFILKFYYYSNVGTARITVTMNGTTFTVGTISSGNNIDIDLTKRIVDGDNTISVKFANDATEAFVPGLNVNGININYSPSFNQYQAFSGNVIFNYACSGSSKKEVHFSVSNSNGTTTTKISHESGYISAYATLYSSMFIKGENIIETYMTAIDDNGNEVARTITTTYKVPFLTDNEPLLMVYFDEWEDLKQYSSISIPYYIWRKQYGNLDSIKFTIAGDAISGGKLEYEYDTEDAGANVTYLQYNASHNWLISNLPTSFINGEDKKLSFSIQGTYDTTELTNKFLKENVSVEVSDSKMQTVSGYKFNFAATDLNRATDIWTSTGTDIKEMQLTGFNWNTDGIQIDSDGNQSLHFSPAATAILAEDTNPLFGNYDSPFTLEISFKVSESASEEPIIKYYNPTALNPDAYGLFIYPNKSIFKYEGGTSEINYIRGERTHLTYTICNKQISDTNPTTGELKTANISYLLVYINGILSQMKQISSNTKFPSSCGTIEFNTNNNDFDLYAFRGYATALTSALVLQNYISGFGNASKKEEIFLSNNVYDDTETTGVPGEFKISFNKVKGKIPTYVIVSDTLPDTKSYVNCYTIFYEKEGDNQITEWKKNHSMATTYYYTRKDESSPWIRNKKIKVGAQGTSSLAYPRKNFKIKHNDKFYIKGHTEGKDKTYTMKADYMDSSGANNIGNAQVMDDAIVREKWINTPVAANPNLRVNLDGFPVAIFWCKSSSLKGGVVQDEGATNVFDNDKTTPLYDAITINAENPLIGEVTPLDPVYIGTFNFNYDKKAKALLGWDEDIFQGFEFRGNSSKANLFKGFENFSAMASTSEGFEWRWTCISDWIDDYHDGHLALTIDGGYFDEDVEQKYSEQEYLANRENIVYLKPFNRFYIERDGKLLQLFEKKDDGSYSPINYGTIDSRNLSWDITSCEGISKPSSGICLEYGIKTAEKDGVPSLVYQLPYGISEANPLGKEYEDGSHYYKFEWNPEHVHYFKYNDTQEYFTNIDNWTTLLPLSKVWALKEEYVEDASGDYVFDEEDEMYHLAINYPEGATLPTTRYTRNAEYVEITTDDTIITWDFMKDIFKNWCYVVEAVAHCNADNYRAVLDSTSRWGQNGNGLFTYDALLNYFAASIVSGLCDNFAKNMFMHSYDGGLTWSPAWYDMD